MTDDPIRILCVDDHVFLAEGLKARIGLERDLEFVGHLASAEGLISKITELAPHVVLIDIEMPGPDVFDVIDELKDRFPRLKPILLSAHVRDQYIDAANTAGAAGYLSKGDSPEAVIKGIRDAMRGQMAYSPSVQDRCSERAKSGKNNAHSAGSKLNLLTKREMHILRMIAKGMSRTDIAEQISRSPMTVDNHRKSIMRKLDIHDRGELVRYAIAEGLVEV